MSTTRMSIYGEEHRQLLACRGIIMPPTQDELPETDGLPMESEQQNLNGDLLHETGRWAFREREDVHVGKDQFLYFSTAQLLTEDYLGPDVYVVLGVARRIRTSWVTWEEGKAPDVVIEVLSPSTRARDMGEKKRIYQDQARIPEYFWYDPITGELAGWLLVGGEYQPILPDEQGRLRSDRLNLLLVLWYGPYHGTTWTWLRWATADGVLVPTQEERAEAAQQQADAEGLRADAAQHEADAERLRADSAERRAAELEEQLRRYRERYNGQP